VGTVGGGKGEKCGGMVLGWGGQGDLKLEASFETSNIFCLNFLS